MKMPPVEKIHEAMSALADGRVVMNADYATVRSSNNEKEYSVKFSGDSYSSDDKGTFWQGYAGYPVIAVLMLQGKLPLRMDLCQHFANINWSELNKKHKRNYSAAAAEVMDNLAKNAVDADEINNYINDTYSKLSGLGIIIKRKV